MLWQQERGNLLHKSSNNLNRKSDMTSLVHSLNFTGRKKKRGAQGADEDGLLSLSVFKDGRLAIPWPISDEDETFFRSQPTIKVGDFFQASWMIINLSEHRSTAHVHLSFPSALVTVHLLIISFALKSLNIISPFTCRVSSSFPRCGTNGRNQRN